MAKSTNFFGLRRGSTKSLTFQVYKGTQVTKDRVTDVSNPQTEAQMKQRLKLSITATARAVLSSLIDHSWEDVDYGDKSLKEFSKANLTKDALSIAEYVPKGYTDTGLATYQISRGSLDPFVVDTPVGMVSQSGNLVVVNALETSASIAVKGSAAKVSKAYSIGNHLDADLLKLISDYIGLGDNEQITLLAVKVGDPYYPFTSSPTTELHYHRFVISRFINDLTKVSAWTVAKALVENDTAVEITDGYLTIIIDTAAEIPAITVVFADDKSQMEGICAIRSAKDGSTWKRSTQHLVVFTTEAHMKAASYANCVDGYLKSETASTKYLNTGTEGVDITGGNA